MRERHWRQQAAAGISVIPSNDFSLYDQVLDTLVLVGATPTRFGTGEVTTEVTLDRYPSPFHSVPPAFTLMPSAPRNRSKPSRQPCTRIRFSPLGCIDGRNIWLSDLATPHARVIRAASQLGLYRPQLAPSCSLLHIPYDTAPEIVLDPTLRGWLAFAQQKLLELGALAAGPGDAATAFAENAHRLHTRAEAGTSSNPTLRDAVEKLEREHFPPKIHYAQRSTL